MHPRPATLSSPDVSRAPASSHGRRQGNELEHVAAAQDVSPPSPDVFGEGAARAAAAHWGHGPDTDVRLLCISENATWLLRNPSGGAPTVLRLNRPGYHSRAAVESELSWTAALRREAVISTPAALATLDGSRVATLSAPAADRPGRHGVMFAYAEGVEPEPENLAAVMPVVGEIAARLHAHARRWTLPGGFTRFSWDLPNALGSSTRPGRWGDWRAGAAGEERPVLERAAARLAEDLLGYGTDRRQYGLIHADLRAANLLVREPDPQVTVIDFDDCGMSWYLYDLAASVSFLEHRSELDELVSGWLEGYRRVGSLEPADLAALPALVMLRRLQLLAWSASHAETQMARSLGDDFAAGTAQLADRYLSGRLLAAIT